MRKGPLRVAWAAAILALTAGAGWGVGSLARWAASRVAGPSGPPVLWDLPGFALTDRGGGTVTRESLDGKVWVADFIFTRCSGICPLLSRGMSSIQKATEGRDDVLLVSITVDPLHDTREVLAEYAGRHGADPSRWLFLTGGWEEIRTLIEEGFHLDVSREAPAKAGSGDLITHSDRMVLVDRHGRVRGTYHGTEEEGIRLLLADLALVAREG